MHDREGIARAHGFKTFAALLEVSSPLPALKGMPAKRYIARPGDGKWFVWIDGPADDRRRPMEVLRIDNAKISEAIRRCFEQCHQKRPAAIFPAVMEFMKSLATTGKWTPTELRLVEGGINRALIFGPTHRAVYAGDATEAPGGNQASAQQVCTRPA